MENQTPEVVLSPQKPKYNLVLWIVVGFATLATGVGIGLAMGKYLQPASSTTSASTIIPSPNPFPTEIPVKESDPTANWKTYANDGISFQYPSDWKINSGTNIFKQGDVVSVYTSVQYDAKVSVQNFLFTAAKPEQTTLGLRDWIDQQNILVPYPGNEAPRLSKDATLGGESAIRVDKCGEGCFSFVYSKHNDKIYAVAYPSSVPTLVKIFDQILSTFKFTGTTPTVTPATNKNVTNFYYKLPDGWKTVQDETGSFEVGYDPNATTTSLTYSPDAISIFIKGNIGGAAMSVHLKNYDGGSRHQFIYKFTNDNQPPQKQDLGSDYNEKEYLYNNKSCLFLRGIYTSQFPNVWGMCDAGSGKAFLITSYVPEYETTLQTIRLLK